MNIYAKSGDPPPSVFAILSLRRMLPHSEFAELCSEVLIK
jgi:hypothetical protein